MSISTTISKAQPLPNTSKDQTFQEVTPTLFEVAPPQARYVAAFVDYLVISASFIALLQFAGDYGFLLTFALGLVYLGVGNSHITAGRTLGKRVFGLRVVHGSQAAFLTLPHSILRYLCSFGLVILLSEIPPLIYRSLAVEGAAHILELPMLGAILYSLYTISRILVSRHHQAPHDILSNSLVLRTAAPLNVSENSSRTYRWKLRPSFSSTMPQVMRASINTAALLLGAILWYLGIAHPAPIAVVKTQQYVLEHTFPIRLIAIEQRAKNSMELQMIATNESSTISLEKLTKKMGVFLTKSGTLSADTDAPVGFAYLNLFDGSSITTFNFDPKTKTVTKLENIPPKRVETNKEKPISDR